MPLCAVGYLVSGQPASGYSHVQWRSGRIARQAGAHWPGRRQGDQVLTTRSGEVAAVLLPHGGRVTVHRPLGPEPRPPATHPSRGSRNPVALIIEPTSPVPRRRRRGLATAPRPGDSGGRPGSTGGVGVVGAVRRGESRPATHVAGRATSAGLPTSPADEVAAPRRHELPLVNPMFLALFATVLLLVGLLVLVLLHPASP
jgi:hypothetical protein